MFVGFLPEGGKFTGQGSFAKRLNNFKRTFDIAHIQGRTTCSEDEGLRTQVEDARRHKKSGGYDQRRHAFARDRAPPASKPLHEPHDTEKVNASVRLLYSRDP